MQFDRKHHKRYNDYGNYIRKIFNGKVWKVSVNAGFTCPNRDGYLGTGGCTFCNNEAFVPAYCETNLSITEQLQKGIASFEKRHPDAKYIAYFQSYTNSYGKLAHLISLYEEALCHPKIEGIIIGTRPDCLPDDLLDYLEILSKKTYIVVELGVESTNDRTLTNINRKHNFETSRKSILELEKRKIKKGVHLILGLPNETREEMINHAKILSKLPIDFLKVHQLQYVKGSKIGDDYLQNPTQFKVFELDEYIDLIIDFIEHTSPSIIFERFASQSPYNLLIAPGWKLKNFEFVHKLEQRMEERDSWQGKLLKEGIVIKSTGSHYLVRCGQEAPIACKIKGKFRLDDNQATNPVAVGDRVAFDIEKNDKTGVITEIFERKNYIIRKSTNLSKQTQILAANIDQAILLVTINFPVTTTVFIDRFLATAEAYNIPAILLFNKIDLYDFKIPDEMKYLMKIYSDIGYPSICLSAEKQENFDEIKNLLKDKITLMAGHSGTGKSTLVNRLEPCLNLKTTEISAAHKTGKHTTTFAEMHQFSFGGYIIDTPGIRGFGLASMEKEELYHFFREIFEISKNCRFYNCTHIHEPGCAVVEAVEKEIIAPSRYQSYISIFFNKDEKYR